MAVSKYIGYATSNGIVGVYNTDTRENRKRPVARRLRRLLIVMGEVRVWKFTLDFLHVNYSEIVWLSLKTVIILLRRFYYCDIIISYNLLQYISNYYTIKFIN